MVKQLSGCAGRWSSSLDSWVSLPKIIPLQSRSVYTWYRVVFQVKGTRDPWRDSAHTQSGREQEREEGSYPRGHVHSQKNFIFFSCISLHISPFLSTSWCISMPNKDFYVTGLNFPGRDIFQISKQWSSEQNNWYVLCCQSPPDTEITRDNNI